VARLSDEPTRIAGTQFQLLGEDIQKAREAKEDSTQFGTAGREESVGYVSCHILVRHVRCILVVFFL